MEYSLNRVIIVSG